MIVNLAPVFVQVTLTHSSFEWFLMITSQIFDMFPECTHSWAVFPQKVIWGSPPASRHWWWCLMRRKTGTMKKNHGWIMRTTFRIKRYYCICMFTCSFDKNGNYIIKVFVAFLPLLSACIYYTVDIKTWSHLRVTQAICFEVCDSLLKRTYILMNASTVSCWSKTKRLTF